MIGSSGPRKLELRCVVTLVRDGRREESLGVPWEGVFEICFVVRLSCFDFTGGTAGDEGDGGVGDEALTLAFLAFLLRSFSSSSEVVTSDRFEQSTLIASELRLARDPNDGTHFSGDPGG